MLGVDLEVAADADGDIWYTGLDLAAWRLLCALPKAQYAKHPRRRPQLAREAELEIMRKAEKMSTNIGKAFLESQVGSSVGLRRRHP